MPCQFVMRGNIGKDGSKCANFKRTVVGNGLVIHTIAFGGDSDVGPCLPDRAIAKHAQGPNQFIRIKVAWQPVNRQGS